MVALSSKPAHGGSRYMSQVPSIAERKTRKRNWTKKERFAPSTTPASNVTSHVCAEDGKEDKEQEAHKEEGMLGTKPVGVHDSCTEGEEESLETRSGRAKTDGQNKENSKQDKCRC